MRERQTDSVCERKRERERERERDGERERKRERENRPSTPPNQYGGASSLKTNIKA